MRITSVDEIRDGFCRRGRNFSWAEAGAHVIRLRKRADLISHKCAYRTSFCKNGKKCYYKDKLIA